MLTESQNYIIDPEGQIKATGDVYLYGKEINDETYAICKSDMMIKGNNPENIKVGSTSSTDEFAAHRFDFMLSNPPYGKKLEQRAETHQVTARMSSTPPLQGRSQRLLGQNRNLGRHPALQRRPTAVPDGNGGQDEVHQGQPHRCAHCVGA
ncbi:N-6 DNA methylase [Roseovarius sp. M141]|uniref:N-6 DNA methylase n=1 Tax=Roseovarius sp. M141 TaxID=2583806 RepID=UPI0020CBA9EA|nr:N-6 DNA methylase [Roseovarius sp. M141]